MVVQEYAITKQRPQSGHCDIVDHARPTVSSHVKHAVGSAGLADKQAQGIERPPRPNKMPRHARCHAW